MDARSTFDKKLDAWKGRIPNPTLDSAVFVNDTLELAWASAQSIFGEKATPDNAFAIFDRIMSKNNARS